MLRLIKDPVNNGLAQFYHTQSNSKKWPNGLKDKISSNKFFSRKTTKKQLFHVPISTFPSANFFKKVFELIQSYEDVHHFRDQTK